MSYDADDNTGRLEVALEKVIAAEPIERRLRAQKLVKPDLVDIEAWHEQLCEQGVLSSEEVEILAQARQATRSVIMVDEFTPEQMVPVSDPVSKVA